MMKRRKRYLLTSLLLMLLAVLPAKTAWGVYGTVNQTNIGKSSATIEWNEPNVKGLSGYRIIWVGTDGLSSKHEINDSKTLFYTIRDLMGGASYKVTVEYKTTILGIDSYTMLAETTVRCAAGGIPTSKIKCVKGSYGETEIGNTPKLRYGPTITFPFKPQNGPYMRTGYEMEVRNYSKSKVLFKVSKEEEHGNKITWRLPVYYGGYQPKCSISRDIIQVRVRMVYTIKRTVQVGQNAAGLIFETKKKTTYGSWSGYKTFVPQPELLEAGESCTDHINYLDNKRKPATTWKARYFKDVYDRGYGKIKSYKVKGYPGFTTKKYLNLFWLRVNGAVYYDIYLAKYNMKTGKASGWKKAARINDNQGEPVQSALLKTYKGKKFRKNQYYIYKIVTYTWGGRKSANDLYSHYCYRWTTDPGDYRCSKLKLPLCENVRRRNH